MEYIRPPEFGRLPVMAYLLCVGFGAVVFMTGPTQSLIRNSILYFVYVAIMSVALVTVEYVRTVML